MDEIFNKISKVDKPWGHELWFALTDKYAGKIIYVNKGQRLSLQYHEQKSESILVLHGKLQLLYGKCKDNLKEAIVEEGQAITITPGTIHRTLALENSTIIEVSTPEVEDVVRIDDDYGRTPELTKLVTTDN